MQFCSVGSNTFRKASGLDSRVTAGARQAVPPRAAQPPRGAGDDLNRGSPHVQIVGRSPEDRGTPYSPANMSTCPRANSIPTVGHTTLSVSRSSRMTHPRATKG